MAENTKMTQEMQRKFPIVDWDDVSEPGAYVDVNSGELYRIPQEALLRGASPLIHKESLRSTQLVQVSKNPFVTSMQARLLACEHNIEPTF